MGVASAFLIRLEGCPAMSAWLALETADTMLKQPRSANNQELCRVTSWTATCRHVIGWISL